MKFILLLNVQKNGDVGSLMTDYTNSSLRNRIHYVTCWENPNKVHLEIDGGKKSEHRMCLK